jgi:hypothetical protein
MHRLASWILIPLLVGLALGALLSSRPVRACECTPDGFWVLERAMVEASDSGVDDSASWPSCAGQVYVDRFSLWGPGQKLDLEYEPRADCVSWSHSPALRSAWSRAQC